MALVSDFDSLYNTNYTQKKASVGKIHRFWSVWLATRQFIWVWMHKLLSVHKSLPGCYNSSIHIQVVNLIYVTKMEQKFPSNVFKTKKKKEIDMYLFSHTAF